jgi:serine/threonine protein kinase
MSLEAATSDSHEPTPFGQYQLIEKIAQGGMAEIFKGRALDAAGLERAIVIKRILPHIAASPEFVEMLIDEAKIAVMLSHGNIAQIYDLGKVADDYFIVMEYVEGKTVSQIMKRLKTQGKLMPIAYACYIVREIAAALDYMHRKTDDGGNPLHIVHRDISPQNAILSTAGTVKIIDFGIAKAKTKVSTTDSGVLKGKFAYMSPEHAEGMKLDHRTDIFSLGVILFELLTGQRLFKGKNNMETVKRVKKAKVPTPSSLRPAVPKVLDQIVFKSLQKDREKRYQSALDMVQDLTKFLVNHYPEFSPREMASYLRDVFPEIVPPDRNPQEETPVVPHEVPKALKPPGGEWSSKEDTVGADSEVIRMKHREAEVFEVEGTQRTDSSSLDVAPEPSKTGFFLRPPVKAALGAAILLLLLGLAWAGVRYGPAMKARFWKTPEQKMLDLAVRKAELMKRLKVMKQNPETAPMAVKPPATEVTQRQQPIPPKTPIAKTEPAKTEPKPEIKPPAPPPPSVSSLGSIAVDSTPPGAHIYWNDVDTGHVTPFVLENVPPGSQRIGLTLDRYRFWEGSTAVMGGQVARVATALQMNSGTLEIRSSPDGAEVTVNGKTAGRTPLTLPDLAPGTLYEIVLNREGYEPWTGTAKIFGGRSEVVNAALVKRRLTEPLPE